MDALVLAGGLGTRLRPILRNLPKPMAPVLGKPFLDHLARYWLKQGISRFIFCVGYRREAVQSYFKNRWRGLPIEYSVESKPLGTGGALIEACKRLPAHKTILALNGDTFFDVPLKSMQRLTQVNDAELTLALAPGSREARFDSVKISSKGRILEILGRKKMGRTGWRNAGVYLFKPELFADYFAETHARFRSFENEILPAFIQAERRVFGYRYRGTFLDIGTPASYQTAESFIREAKIWKKF